MAAGQEQDTTPISYEAQLASIYKTRKLDKPQDPITYGELLIYGFGGLSGLFVFNFIFQEVVKYIKDFSQ